VEDQRVGQAAVRMSRVDRRGQLLDVAAELVTGRGPAAVTIERLAGEAGVSRALAYQHFDNAEEVLVALYRREVAALGEAILAAVAAEDEPESRLRAAVATFLDIVGARHGLFTVLAAAGSPVPARADDGTRAGHRFTQSLFEQIFGLAPRRAQVAAAMTFGALNGGVEAWAAGELRRGEVEDAALSVALALTGEPR
jgi:AcrR family transcriptional regulator